MDKICFVGNKTGGTFEGPVLTRDSRNIELKHKEMVN